MPKVTINPLGPPFDFVGSGGGGSGTPAAPDTSVQFNDGGSFGGDAGLTWDKTLQRLTIASTGDDAKALTVDAIATNASGFSSNVIRALTSGTENMVAAQALDLKVRHDSSGTLDEAYGLAIESASTSGGAIATGYGIFVNDQTDATTNYAIKTGAGLVSFGDEVDMADGKGIKLSTTDPHVAGVLWNNSGLAVISSG